jgi:Holliday junction resolvase RusA-like endonuclease
MNIELVKRFTIKGKPQHQERHRHRVVDIPGQKAFATTYDKCKKAKELFAEIASSHRPDVPFDCPLQVDVTCYFEHCKSDMGTGRNAGNPKPSAPQYHTKKPDLDNLAKFVYDALTGLFWRDDSIIITGLTKKVYASEAMTMIEVYKIKGGA